MKMLFKADSSGRIRQWDIRVVGNGYVVSHGVKGGKLQHKTTQCKPKNIGRSNETNAPEQAIIEAEALHKKMIERECYVADIDDSPAYLQPQLALDATKVGHRIPWQQDHITATPKLDGVRAIWTPKGIQSRKGTFYSVPRIEDALSKVEIPLDGELYLHGVPLNQINGAARKQCDLTDQLEFHVFDVAVPDLTFDERWEMILGLNLPIGVIEENASPIKRVGIGKVTQVGLEERHRKFVELGFEGVMLRDGHANYGFGERNPSLFKYKTFHEDEFLITGVHADKHGDQGMLELITGQGTSFSSRSRGTDDYRRQMLNEPELFIGRMATIRYFAMTEYGVPQFPVVVNIGAEK